MKEKKSQLKMGVILSYIYNFLQMFISISFTPIIIKSLGQSEYGLYNLAYSTISYLSILSLGFGSTYIQFYTKFKSKNDRSAINRLNGMFLCIFAILGTIAAALGSLLVVFARMMFSQTLTSHEITVARIIMILALVSLVVSLLGSVFDSFIIAHERYIFQKIVLIIKALANPLVTLILLANGYKSVSLTITISIITILGTLTDAIYCISKLHMRFNFHEFDFGLLKNMWFYSFFIFLAMVTEQINWNLDKFIIGIKRGVNEVAIYTVGAQINTYYMGFATVVSAVYIPKVHRIVENNKDSSEINQLFIDVGKLQFKILFWFLTAFGLFGKFFIHLWAGKGYEQAYTIAMILLAAVTIPMIQDLGVEIQRAKNMHKFRSYVYLTVAVINALISFPLCAGMGAIGCAIGTLVTVLIGQVIIMNIYYVKRLGIDIGLFFRKILFEARYMVIPLVFGFYIYKNVEVDSAAKFGIWGMAYMVVYIASVFSTDFLKKAKEKKVSEETVKY